MRAAAIAVLAVLATACVQLPYTGGARPVAPAQMQLDDHWLKAAPTPVVRQQQETDCGLAALAMIAGAWGRSWNVGELTSVMPPGREGVRLGVLRDYARSHQLDAFAIAASAHDLEHELGAGRPVLLGLMLPFDRGHNQSHYEVAIAMNPATGTVITIDPASGRWMKRSRAVLDAEWKAAGYAALVVTGDQRGNPVAQSGEPR
ncbi:MAG TPA: cysteine peptidase family C39 domain-containing protein [Kofleriaceae bacterium]|jgi:ABC-type bacteriocin/lantibiotic exporter with double-glycine peptidase domain